MLLAPAEAIFRHIVEWGILILEFFGVSVLLVTSIISITKWLRRMPDVRSTLAQGILLALSFKMGGEVLRTVIIEEPKEMFIIFGIIILRGIVAGLIYWEIGKEVKIEAMVREQKLSHGGRKRDEEDQEQTVAET